MGRIPWFRMVLVAAWAIIGFVTWHMTATTYERLLGSVAWEYFPDKVFLNLREGHVFAIGLKDAVDTAPPQLTLQSHNFGYGLILTGSIILGTTGRTLIARSMGLISVWLLLFLSQAGLLVAAAHNYLSATTQSDISGGVAVFIKSVHPTVTILPVLLVVSWLAIPSMIRGSQGQRRPNRLRPIRRR